MNASSSHPQQNKSSKIKIGFIGLSGNKGWALKSHYFCVKSLPENFDIVAVCNTSYESSENTIKELNLVNCKPFGNDYDSFVRYKEIDMIVVSVRVADHFKILMNLLNTKEMYPNECSFKILFVEWALGNGLEEAKAIYEKSRALNVQSIISLQGRYSPYMLLAKNLIRENRIGIINCIEVSANGGWYGYQRPYDSPDYLFDINSGHNLVTTAFAHTIDSIQYITGSYMGKLNAMLFDNIKKQQLVGSNTNTSNNSQPEFKSKTVPDHLLFQGILQKGNIPISLSFKGGNPSKKFTKNLVIDIHGTRGDLKIEGNAGFPEISNLVLYFCGLPPSKGIQKDTNGSQINITGNKKNSVNSYGSVNVNSDFQNEPENSENILFYNEDDNQVVEKYHMSNYNPVVGNMMRLYEAIAQYYNPENLLEMQGLSTAGFPTFKDAVMLHDLIDSVFTSSATGRTVDINLPNT